MFGQYKCGVVMKITIKFDDDCYKIIAEIVRN